MSQLKSSIIYVATEITTKATEVQKSFKVTFVLFQLYRKLSLDWKYEPWEFCGTAVQIQACVHKKLFLNICLELIYNYIYYIVLNNTSHLKK